MISIPAQDRKEVCQKGTVNLQRNHVQESLICMKMIAASRLKVLPLIPSVAAK